VPTRLPEMLGMTHSQIKIYRVRGALTTAP
jgi:hypothetical protein